MDNPIHARPKFHLSHDPMYRMLREECIKELNVKKASGDNCTSAISTSGTRMLMASASASAIFVNLTFEVLT